MTSSMIELIYHSGGATYTDSLDTPDQYLVSGGTEDWAYGELGIYSFGIELRPVTFGQGGFRLPENQIIPTCVENLPVALYAVSFAAADYGIQNLTTSATYNNIQLAVNDANDGDEIAINPGVYHEHVNIIDKNLTLRSIDPDDPAVVASTVIHIEDLYQGPVVTLLGHENGVCELAGLTISGGQVGVSCCDSTPTIRNCTIESNGPDTIEFWEECVPPTTVGCTISGQVVEVEDPTLIAYWLLDETEGLVAHDRTGQYDGTLNGDPQWRSLEGKVGGALEFDGIDDYVSTEFVLDPADGAFTVLAWIKGGMPGQAILSQADGVNWLCTDSAEGCLMTALKNPGRASVGPMLSQTAVSDDNWHRIGVVWDGSCRHLYVDGAEVAVDDAPLPLPPMESSSGGLYIGAGKSLEPGTLWSGMIDDVRIYNRAVKL